MYHRRFSSDVSKVDDSLPFILNIFLAQARRSTSSLFRLCFVPLLHHALLPAPGSLLHTTLFVTLLLSSSNTATAAAATCTVCRSGGCVGRHEPGLPLGSDTHAATGAAVPVCVRACVCMCV
jgi:hypothetical protein